MMGFGLLVPILIVVVLAYAFGWLPGPEQQPLRREQRHTTPSALDILAERYARGEISRAEYLELRDDLSR